jgi:hypothetical protein
MNINYTEPKSGKSSAVCQCCGRMSRAVATDSHGEPDLWLMARGWSMDPFLREATHTDGSRGSRYTCPTCNTQLRAGKILPLRGTPSAAP